MGRDGESLMSIVTVLRELGLLKENGELDPDAVKDLCTAFVDAYMDNCPECLDQDPEFWMLTSEQRVIHVVAYALSLYLKRSVSPLTVASVVKVTKESINACREAFERAGFGW